MSNAQNNGVNLNTIIKSSELGFIPIRFWKQREISISDFINLLKNEKSNAIQSLQFDKEHFSHFNHKLWCILQVTVNNDSFYNLFGAKWKDFSELTIEINSSIFSNFFADLAQKDLIYLFESNGWENIDNKESGNLLFTLNYKFCLNNILFDVDFYEQLTKFSNENVIQKLGDLLTKSLLFLLQNENIEKSINYSSKSSETITLDCNFNDDSIITDVVHFVTFPGEILFDKNQQSKGNVQKIFKKVDKDQLLFDESSFNSNYNGIKVILELPPVIHFPLLPKSNEFSQSMIIINALLIFSSDFKALFFEKCIDLASKIEDNKIFFEFISILLILLKSHQFDLKSFNPIILSPLFDDYATVYNYSEDYQKVLFLREQWINLSFGFNENMMSIFQRKFSFYKEIFQSLRNRPIGFSEFTLIVSQDFNKMPNESQNYIMLLMAQTNVFYFVCLKQILLKDFDDNNNELLLNKNFYYQQMMNVIKLNNFDCVDQFNYNFNQLNDEDKKKVSAIIQARFSILTFFYKNFNLIFKTDDGQHFNAYQFKTFKLILSLVFEISLQKQTLSLIESKEDFHFDSNNEKDFSFFDQFSQIYFKIFNKKANDIITVTFCDNLIKYLHDKIYKILLKEINKTSKENCWINFLFEILPNIVYWYSVIDNSFIPNDIIQQSICNTISFITTCLSSTSIPPNDHLHDQFVKIFDSLYDELEHVCLFYFMNSESYRDLLFKKLLNLAAEKELNSIYNHFVIKLGKAIKILMKIFFNESTFSYLNNICFLDIRNCYQLTENGVDILLINYLYNNRNNRNIENEDLFLSILEFSKTLAFQHSSLSFVKKFISIFTPINGSFLPYYTPLFINTLNDLSMKEQKIPSLSIPLLDDCCNLNVFNIDSELFNNGLTFSFWIFINNTILAPRKLLTIRQKREIKDKKIIIVLNPNRKFSLITSDEEDSMGPTKEQISDGQWHFIMISFNYRKKDLRIRIQTDDSLLHRNKPNSNINAIFHSSDNDMKSIALSKSESSDFSQFFDFSKFEENKKLQICIGAEDDSTYFASNNNNNSNNESDVIFSHIQCEDLISNYNKSILLGPIGMFPLIKGNSQYIYYMFNSVHEIPSKALFYAYPFPLSDGIVTFKFESNQFNSVSFPVKFKFNSPFIKVLINNNLTDKLIELFGLNDLRSQSQTIRIDSSYKSYIFKEVNDCYYLDYTNAAIGIFRSIFTMSEDAQNEMIKINGFHIICHLLTTMIDDTIKINEMIEKNLHSISLDFFLYKNFVSLFESLSTKSCQKQFLNDILFNIELWIKSKDFDMILNHWYESLIPDFYNEFFNKYSIISILTIMRLYFYLEPKEKTIIKERKIDIEKVKACRKIFWSIISSSDHFNQIDLSTMVSHATTCPDFQHVSEIIKFFSNFFDYKVKSQLNEENLTTSQETSHKKKFFNLFQEITNTKNASVHPNKLNNIDFQDYNSILQLNLLFSCSQHEIAKEVIILFIKLYQVQFVNEISFEDHFDLICMNLQNFENPENFLDELLNYFCPQILPLCIIIALQVNTDESLTKVINIMETFERPEKFCVSKSWFLWPVISCFLRPHCYERMMDLLIKYPQTEWPGIYNSMLISGIVLNINPRKYIHYFLTTISTNLCDNYDDSKADMFFKIAFYFLFIKLNKDNVYFENTFNTQEIFRRIMSLKKFYESENFNVEVDDQGCLIEADIVQVILSLFEIKHPKAYSDFIVILSAHQLPFENTPLDRFKKLNCIIKSDAFYYYDAIALKLEKDLLTKEDPQKIYIYQSEYNNQFISKYKQFFSPLDTNDFLLSMQVNFEKIDVKFKKFLNDKFNNISTNLFRNYVDNYEMIKKSYKNLWSSFWLSNSVEKDSMFHYEIQTDNLHFKRDNSSCFFYCPFKLIKNKKFNDHLKESLFRDCGNIAKAEIQYQQIKEEEENKNKSKNHKFYKIDLNKEVKSEIIELQNNDDKIIYQTNDCERRKPNKSYFVSFIIYKNRLQIGSRIISYEKIKSIFLRYVRQHQTAIEIFLINGKSYFLNFPKLVNSFIIVSRIQQTIQIDNPSFSSFAKSIVFQSTCSNKFFFESKSFTQKWINGEISNFEYLMIINIYSGRTFNDGMFYPVMPWIIQDYDSNELNLNDPSFFRDLSLPIGAVNPKRYEMLFKSYISAANQDASFLYSSWLICPLSLYVWLVRLEPFTTNHVKIQGGKFDIEQRIFHSIKAAYVLCTHDNNDFRELIPEFFFQPEFLINTNHFDLGESTRNENENSNVGLPNWAKNPFEFIYKHRKALESDIVSKKLNKWIDLTFGCKQKSEEDKNIYRKELYSDVWETEFGKVQENVEQICYSLDLLGQIPQPLFDSPHPEKQILTKEEILKNCEDKWPSKEYTIQIGKDLDLVDLKRKQTNQEKSNLFIVYSIVNKENNETNENNENNEFINYYLYLYCLEFITIKEIVDKQKLIALTYLLKYEMKPNSIDFVSSSLLSIEPIESELNSLSITSNYIKDVSQFGFTSTIGNCIYFSFDLLNNDNDNKQKKFIVKNEIGCTFEKVAVSNLYVSAIDNDSNTLHIFNKKLKNENESSFRIHLNDCINDSISCTALSDSFNICVCGTKSSSSIILVSLNKEEVERIIELDKNDKENKDEIEIPLKIIITHSWGFILVLTKTMKVQSNELENEIKNIDDSNICHFDDSKYHLHLFNVNGYFIDKSGEFKFDTSQKFEKVDRNQHKSLFDLNLSKIFNCRHKNAIKWICWTSNDGFDFILMADLHSVYSFEAFNCSNAPGNPILTFQNEIVGLDFIKKGEKVVVTLDDGRVVISSINNGS